MRRALLLLGGAVLAGASFRFGMGVAGSDRDGLIILEPTETASFPPAEFEVVEGSGSGIAARLNAVRARIPTNRLSESRALDQVASEYAAEMYATGVLSHVDARGRSPFARLRDANVPYIVAGETIGLGDSIDDVIDGFLRSDSHRAVLLDSGFCEFGTGIVEGGSGTLVVLMVRSWREPTPVRPSDIDEAERGCDIRSGP